MAVSSSTGKLRISVACGPVPCDSEEGRSMLQKRQAALGLILFGLFAAYTAGSILLAPLGAAESIAAWIRGPESWISLATCGLFLVLFLLSRFGAPSRLYLAATDVLGMLLFGMLAGSRYVFAEVTRSSEAVALLALLTVLLVRCVVVPSSAFQTFLASAVAAAPLLAGYRVHAEGVCAASGESATAAIALLGLWYAAGIASATVISRVIYGLRQEVLEAKQLGQYTLVEKIGEGGMGQVYRASHAMLRRPTAIKILRAEATGERGLARFEREVQLTSSLTHPNTIAVYDYGRTPDGLFYYAMEYLDGLDLGALVAGDGPQPAGRVIHILRQVCGSLHEAHRHGLIHRDVKPANIILCERGAMWDVVKVVDFGLVKDIQAGGDGTISGANTITGTPLYLSPEAIRSPAEIDARSDLYSLGAVGYFLLAGTHLFDSKNAIEVCSLQLTAAPEPPSRRLGRPVPRDLEALILRCLEKDPAARPRDARALSEALGHLEHAGIWSEEDAARWWRRVAPGIRKAREAREEPRESRPPLPRTATVPLRQTATGEEA